MYRVFEFGKREVGASARPLEFEDREIKAARLGRAAPGAMGKKRRFVVEIFEPLRRFAELFSERTGFRFVNGFALPAQPVADGAEVDLALLGDNPLGGGPDVEEVIASFRNPQE